MGHFRIAGEPDPVPCASFHELGNRRGVVTNLGRLRPESLAFVWSSVLRIAEDIAGRC